MVLTACPGGDDDGSSATSPTATVDPTTTDPDTTDPPTTTVGAETTTIPDDTTTTSGPVTDTTAFPTTTSVVVGTALGGSSGGVGEEQTNRLSATVREADGTCSGWSGPGGTWTQGLEPGAPVVFLAAASDTQIGTGRIVSSGWTDVDPGSNEQWSCAFEFSGDVEGDPPPATFRIRVGQLDPWRVERDPTTGDAYVAMIETPISAALVPECADPPGGTAVFEWRSVGQHWANGLPSLCGEGLVVTAVERTCRPEGFANDHIVSVVSAADPTDVYEDRTGLRVDPADIVRSVRRPFAQSPDPDDTTTTSTTIEAPDPDVTSETTTDDTTTDVTTGDTTPGSRSAEVIVRLAGSRACS